MGAGGDSGAKLVSAWTFYCSGTGCGSILGSMLDSTIDKLGYRFCDHLCDVLFVAVEACWSRFWSYLGVQRVTEIGKNEI